MHLSTKSALIALAALAVPAMASADTYTLAHFSGGIFGGNANAQAPFGDAGIHQGMALSGTFLRDNSLTPAASGFDNKLFANYADDAIIPDAVDFTFNIGSLVFTDATSDAPGGAVQFKNGHFNGFAYSSNFTFENVLYNLSIQGTLFSINSVVNPQLFVSGFINGGDGAVTGGTPFTPTTPGTGGGGVPEPATWAMMIAGFGGIGAMMRRRRSLALTA